MRNSFADTNLRTPTLQVTPSIVALGDPHLGRVFKTGVALERRGERETLQRETFRDSLMNVGSATLHVMMGDLFDEPRVPEEVVMFAYEAYGEAATKNPNTDYVLIAGNHDLHRDTDKKASFELLAVMLSPISNITVVMDEPQVIHDCLMVPWQPFQNSNEFLSDFPFDKVDLAFGHWDFIEYDEAKHNGIPYASLVDRCQKVVTGHYHKRGIHRVVNESNFFDVLVTGSMLPYAHGEDTFDEQYQTLSLAEVEAKLADDPDAFTNVVLRVQLTDDDAPIELNALALTFQKVGTDSKKLEVNVDEFSLEAVFRSTFKQHKVTTETTEKLWLKAAARNI